MSRISLLEILFVLASIQKILGDLEEEINVTQIWVLCDSLIEK